MRPRRRLLLVLPRTADAVEDLAAGIRAAATPSGLDGLAVESYRSTGGYRLDPNRPQEFVPVAGAVQVDYDADDEPALGRLVQGIERAEASADAVISAGSVVTCLEPTGPYLLLLGAQRRPDLTPGQFGAYWSQTHAPHAVTDLRAAPVPIGYELFLVDHELTAAVAGTRWRPSAVDGWMHLTTRGPSDLAGVIQDPEHRAWVLQDETNFVDFSAPLTGQQLRAGPHPAPTPSTIR